MKPDTNLILVRIVQAHVAAATDLEWTDADAALAHVRAKLAAGGKYNAVEFGPDRNGSRVLIPTAEIGQVVVQLPRKPVPIPVEQPPASAPACGGVPGTGAGDNGGTPPQVVGVRPAAAAVDSAPADGEQAAAPGSKASLKAVPS